MPTIVVASPKGGVGKSTTANILMTTLARRGATVTGVDADPNRPQVNWARRAGVKVQSRRPKHHSTILPNLTILEEAEEQSLISTHPGRRRTYPVRRRGHGGGGIPVRDLRHQPGRFGYHSLRRVLSRRGRGGCRAAYRRGMREDGTQTHSNPRSRAVHKNRSGHKVARVREVEHQLVAHKTPMYDVRLHKRDAYAAVFSRGVPLHDIEPKTIHKLDVAIENAEAFVKETIRRLDRAQSNERAVA